MEKSAHAANIVFPYLTIYQNLTSNGCVLLTFTSLICRREFRFNSCITHFLKKDRDFKCASKKIECD